MFPGFSLPKRYHYPDGTSTTTRPKDGQIFKVWDANQKPLSTWQWDDVKEQWFNISSGVPTPLNTQTFVLPNSIEYVEIKLDLSNINTVKCECGSDAVGSPRHSNWCAKHVSSAE